MINCDLSAIAVQEIDSTLNNIGACTAARYTISLLQTLHPAWVPGDGS